MRKATATIVILPLVFLVLLFAADAAIGDIQVNAVQDDVEPSVVLRARSGLTVTFRTQNGETIEHEAPQTMELAHLVLYRNGELTDAGERTLDIEVNGIDVPPGGVTVTLKLETQHGIEDLGGGVEHRIPVWRASQQIANTTGVTQTRATATFEHAFGGAVSAGAEAVPTPTDYFRYEVAVIGSRHPITAPLQTFALDFAFLMENQWVARLPEVQEDAPGAAPDELIVSYCDMFPFRVNDGENPWHPREDVGDFVGSELVPAMVEAFLVQTDDWGFPWYEEWTSFRGGEEVERLSVALTKEGVWYHGHAPYPALGHAGIALRVDAKHNAAYETLTDALMSAFHHELFHSLQRNLQQHYGSSGGGGGDVDGAQDAWQFFSEGTAVLASSVGQPGVQFAQTSYARHYVDNADWYLGHGLPQGDLNRSYGEMNPYHATLYWRFLYEQCGGLNDPAAGMDVIRRALAALYDKQVIDIGLSMDLVGALPRIMDQTLAQAGAACPFKTYRDSLTAFSSAIYALRLEGGRCNGADSPNGCGFYDPQHLYHDPPAGTITYTGAPVAYDAARQSFPTGIQSSYGMDFVEVILDPETNGRSLTLEFYGAPGAGAEFSLQLWKLMDEGEGLTAQGVTGRAANPEILTEMDADGRLVYAIPALDATATNRLGLVITRLDANEDSDPTGAYTIVVQPGAGSESAGVNP